ncbi:MAG TPA: hypothetical protein VMV10_23675 [Pirellulales bacterium]|nr:hypothetical protein [Pirellulales bacterium]
MDAPFGRFVELPWGSACVDEARRQFSRRIVEGPDPPLRNLLYYIRSGDRHESRYGLQDLDSRKVVGEILYRWKTWGDGDPVEIYLGIRLRSGRALEAIGFRCEPGTLYLFDNGNRFGRFIEKQLPPDKRWWRRMLGGERLWHVHLQEEFIGVLQLVYPVGKRTVIHVQLHNGVTWPICVASLAFRKESRFVIPPEAPEVPTDDLKTLYFMLSSIMRLHVCNVDLDST